MISKISKKKKKSRLPLGHSTSSEFDYKPCYCHSFGCDILVKKDENIVRNYYTFTPQFFLNNNSRVPIINNDKISIEYCECCFNDSFINKKKKNFKRIFACWDKDDYGFVETPSKCDFCGKISNRLSRRQCIFKTNDIYMGVRNDDNVFICACNKCIKKNPKNVYKLIRK
jgi:hypothetical protein